jgi:hypothetical protein
MVHETMALTSVSATQDVTQNVLRARRRSSAMSSCEYVFAFTMMPVTVADPHTTSVTGCRRASRASRSQLTNDVMARYNITKVYITWRLKQRMLLRHDIHASAIPPAHIQVILVHGDAVRLAF